MSEPSAGAVFKFTASKRTRGKLKYETEPGHWIALIAGAETMVALRDIEILEGVCGRCLGSGKSGDLDHADANLADCAECDGTGIA